MRTADHPTVTASRHVYGNRWMSVREDMLLRPDGSHAVYTVVERPDFALVVPWAPDGLVMVEQYRHPLGRRTLEFPQGSDESAPSRDPADLARAELAEETGMRAAELRPLGCIHLAVGLSPQMGHVFAASELVSGVAERDPGEQDMRVRVVPVEDFQELVACGAIGDAATLAAWTLFITSLARGFGEPA